MVDDRLAVCRGGGPLGLHQGSGGCRVPRAAIVGSSDRAAALSDMWLLKCFLGLYSPFYRIESFFLFTHSVSLSISACTVFQTSLFLTSSTHEALLRNHNRTMGNIVSVLWNLIHQSFPPAPRLTERNLPSQKGKVFLVTGGYSGVGFELTKILFHAGGKVYVAGRSRESAHSAIEAIEAQRRPTSGHVEYLPLDLADLASVRAAASAFRSQEQKLNVLFNNAAVSMSVPGSTSAQGLEMQIATNAVGPYLFTELLAPCLRAAGEVKGRPARVVWTSSIVVDVDSKKGGFKVEHVSKPETPKWLIKRSNCYTNSKVANWYLAAVMARRAKANGDNVLHITQNPGNLNSNLLRDVPIIHALFRIFLYHSRYGAYTELWAGLSDDLTMKDAGSYVIPWGRKHTSQRKDLLKAVAPKSEGGTGRADEFVEWCDDQTKDFSKPKPSL